MSDVLHTATATGDGRAGGHAVRNDGLSHQRNNAISSGAQKSTVTVVGELNLWVWVG